MSIYDCKNNASICYGQKQIVIQRFVHRCYAQENRLEMWAFLGGFRLLSQLLILAVGVRGLVDVLPGGFFSTQTKC